MVKSMLKALAKSKNILIFVTMLSAYPECLVDVFSLLNVSLTSYHVLYRLCTYWGGEVRAEERGGGGGVETLSSYVTQVGTTSLLARSIYCSLN